MTTANGKTALITGASKGIGLETARQLGAAGCRVLIGARDPGRGEKAAAELRSEGTDARCVPLDVREPRQIDAAAAWVRDTCGALDILVNNAGINVEWPAAPPSEVDPEALRGTLETNVLGVAAVTNAFLPLLRESPAGRVVNVSSEMGLPGWLDGSPMPAITAYSLSKAALNVLTVLYANELRDTAVKVNACSPGFVRTDINRGAGERSAAEGAGIEVALALLDADGPTGTFCTDEGVRPW